MTETAFRVVVPPQDHTGILAYGPELRRAIQFHGFEGVTVTPMDATFRDPNAVVAMTMKAIPSLPGWQQTVWRPTPTVTPMDDALIKAAEDAADVLEMTVKGYADDLMRGQAADRLRAAIANARGDTK